MIDTAAEEWEVIVLPCRHAASRPGASFAKIACPCGRRWEVQLEPGGQAWKAQEIHGA